MILPQPTGYRILIEPIEVKQETASGIALPDISQKAQEHLRYIGKVVSMGEEAYQHAKFTAPWCKEGDWVAHGQYAGQELQVRTDDGTAKKYRLVNDDEILAVVDPATMMIYDI
jgi:co-chaperonin GroES (HSP10)